MGKRRSGRFRGSAARPVDTNSSVVDVASGVAIGIFGLFEQLLHKQAGGWGSRTTTESLTDTFTTSDDTWIVGDTVTFSKSTGQKTFPIRNGKVFRIALYGGAGGGIGTNNSNGGTLDVAIDLTSYQNSNLYIYSGGQGSNSSSSIDGSCGCLYSGGFNGGGQGCGTRGPGGGGRTDLRTSTSSTSELLVAAGGGGGYGTLGSTGTRVNGSQGCSGLFGSYCGDNGGGGGGYYGGSASCADDGSNGGSGTNYYNSSLVSTVYTNTRISGTSGGNSGNGYFTITVVSVG
jgi:hypothetical protein